jgi:hypothetical protein
MKYIVNYYAVLMMQRLGMSLEGLAMMLAFLGLGPGVGGTEKWKDIQEAVGAAQQEVCEDVLAANTEKEMALTLSDAEKKVNEWADTTEEGKTADDEAKRVKLQEFVEYVDGQDGQPRLGLTAAMDGVWEKRSSGHNYNSRTGHNFFQLEGLVA